MRSVALVVSRLLLALTICSVLTSCMESEDATPTAIAQSEEPETPVPPQNQGTIFAAGGDALWIADGASGNLVRVDPLDPDSVTRIEVGLATSSVAVSQDLVWAADDRVVAVLNPRTASVTATIEMGGRVADVIETSVQPWVLMLDPGGVVPLDPISLEAGTAIFVDDPIDAAATENDLWVVRPNELIRIDLSTAERIAGYEIPFSQPAAIDALRDTIVVVSGDGDALKVDASTGIVQGIVSLPIDNALKAGIVVEGDRFWILDDRSQLVGLDAELNLLPRVEVGTSADGLAVAADALWLISNGDSTLIRIGLDGFRTIGFPMSFPPVAIATG